MSLEEIDADAERPSLTQLAATRHPSVRSAARWLETGQRSSDRPPLANLVARRFERTAERLLALVKADDPELTRALVLLTQAKDAAVRAAIAESEQT